MKCRVKISPGQLPLFVEKDFDSRAILVGLYDFKTCSRSSDGSFYGTADSNQCRIGTEVSIDDMKEQMNVRNKKVKADSAAVLSGSFNAGLTVAPAKASDIEAARKEIGARTKELEKKLNSNEDVTKEMENFIENRRFLGDHMSAKTIVVGMEDATPSTAKDPEGYTKFLAEKIAKNEYKLNNPDKSVAADYADQAGDKEAQFHQRHTKILTTLTNTTNSPADMISPGGAIAQLELRSVPAPMASADKWMAGKVPAIANNPELNAKLGTRGAYEKNYDEKMKNNVADSIMRAAKGNPNLDTVVMSMGGAGRPTADQIMYDLSKNPNSRYREFKYTPDEARGTVFTGRILDPTGKGKPLIYDYGASASAQQFQSAKSSFGTGRKFREEAAKLRNNETSSKSSLRENVRQNNRKAQQDDLKARIKQAKADGRDADEKALRKTLKGLK